MIVKERNPGEHSDENRLSKAGAEAEEQMAFYLRRAFAKNKRIDVFNDLRITSDEGDAAQVDHLILHRHGFIIIESKSATGTLRINKHGEWQRIAGQRRQGMQSPVQQAVRQGEFLQRYLNEHCELLRPKVLFGKIQFRFDATPFEVLIAVSDKGIIERKAKVPEVHKADAIVEKIRAIVKKHRNANIRLSWSDGIEKFSDLELENIRSFLTTRHRPRKSVTPKPAPSAASDKSPNTKTIEPSKSRQIAQRIDESKRKRHSYRCRHCDNRKLHVKYGRYGYYFKCSSCDKNTSINFVCPSCGKKAKIRKSKERFNWNCDCGEDALFFVNPQDATQA